MYQLFKWLGLCRRNKNTKPCHWVPNNANLMMQSCNQGALNLIPAFISSCLTVTDWLPLRPSVVAVSYISDFFFLTVCSSTLKSSGRGLMSSPEAKLKPQNLLLNMEKVENGELVYFRQSDWSGTRQTKDNRRINIDGRQNVLKIDTLEKLRIIIWK